MDTGKFILGVTLQWTRIPSKVEHKYSQSLQAAETRISSDLMGYLARKQTLLYIWNITGNLFIKKEIAGAE